MDDKDPDRFQWDSVTLMVVVVIVVIVAAFTFELWISHPIPHVE